MTGSILGYFARQSIAKRQANNLETTLHRKLSEAKTQAELIITKARDKSRAILDSTEERKNEIRKELSTTENFLRKKEFHLEKESDELLRKQDEFNKRVEKLKELKESISVVKQETEKKLEEISGLSKKDAKATIFDNLEKEYQSEILARIRQLESEGDERYERKAKEILSTVIQRQALLQTQEITTSSVPLPNDEIKGRIIGKEGRNIKVLEKLTMICEESGIVFRKVPPQFTSQRCSICGVICKSNRRGEIYKCACGNVIDADYNASLNILHVGKYGSHALQSVL